MQIADTRSRDEALPIGRKRGLSVSLWTLQAVLAALLQSSEPVGHGDIRRQVAFHAASLMLAEILDHRAHGGQSCGVAENALPIGNCQRLPVWM